MSKTKKNCFLNTIRELNSIIAGDATTIEKFIVKKRAEIHEEVKKVVKQKNSIYERLYEMEEGASEREEIEKLEYFPLQIELNRLVRADWLCLLTEEVLKEKSNLNSCLNSFGIVMSEPVKEELNCAKEYVNALTQRKDLLKV